MELPINQDPETLNKSVYSGWKPWQYICMGISIVAAVVFVLIFREKVGITLCSIICAAIVAPPGYIATYKKNGMNFFEYRKKKKVNKAGVYVYISGPYKISDTSPAESDKKEKKKGAGYIIKNLITGGKNI